MEEWSVYALSFAASVSVAAILLGPLVVFYRRVDEPELEPGRRAFGPANPLLARLLPVSAEGREAIRGQVVLAGHYRKWAVEDYFALRNALTVGPPLACWALALPADGPAVAAFFALGLALGALGYSATRLYVQAQGTGRREEVRRGLPMFMDTLGLALSAGAGLPEGMGRAAESIRRGYPELTREVRLVVAQAGLRSMSHALDAWRVRLPIPELGSLVFLLSQADRLGTDITRGLWELSASFQVTSRQRAEAAANRANFYLLFPTVFCLLLAAALVLAGPPLVLLNESFDDFSRVLEEANRNQKDAERSGKDLSGKVQPPQVRVPPPR